MLPFEIHRCQPRTQYHQAAIIVSIGRRTSTSREAFPFRKICRCHPYLFLSLSLSPPFSLSLCLAFSLSRPDPPRLMYYVLCIVSCICCVVCDVCCVLCVVCYVLCIVSCCLLYVVPGVCWCTRGYPGIAWHALECLGGSLGCPEVSWPISVFPCYFRVFPCFSVFLRVFRIFRPLTLKRR